MERNSEKSTAILVVSFGTSFNHSRSITVGGIENVLREVFQGVEVRRAFTSQMIIRHLERREGLKIDNVPEALERAMQDGIQNLYIQPTHMMAGHEYFKMKRQIDEFLQQHPDVFTRLCIGAPLLSEQEDFIAVEQLLRKRFHPYETDRTAIVLMGHGTDAGANAVYEQLQAQLRAEGAAQYFIGTVEAKPDCEDVIAMLDGKGYERIVLAPLMIVAGDHAHNDMAGDEEESWKRKFEEAGYRVDCIMEGLGQWYETGMLFAKHLHATGLEQRTGARLMQAAE